MFVLSISFYISFLQIPDWPEEVGNDWAQRSGRSDGRDRGPYLG